MNRDQKIEELLIKIRSAHWASNCEEDMKKCILAGIALRDEEIAEQMKDLKETLEFYAPDEKWPSQSLEVGEDGKTYQPLGIRARQCLLRWEK